MTGSPPPAVVLTAAYHGAEFPPDRLIPENRRGLEILLEWRRLNNRFQGFRRFQAGGFYRQSRLSGRPSIWRCRWVKFKERFVELYERVDAVITRMAKSRSQMSKKLEIKQTTFNSWFSPARQDNLWPVLHKILALYPHISREWLYFGDGEMIKSKGDEGPPVSQSREKELLLRIEQLSGLVIKLENQIESR